MPGSHVKPILNRMGFLDTAIRIFPGGRQLTATMLSLLNSSLAIDGWIA